MPVSGWVLTLPGNGSDRARVRQILAGDPRVTLGDVIGARLPFVLNTSTVTEERTLIEALDSSVEGLRIDLVFLDFTDEVPRHRRRLPRSIGHRVGGPARVDELQ